MVPLDAQGESLDQMIFVLLKDVERAIELAKASDSQYDRRSFVRTAFVAIEGASYLMRTQCISRVERGSKIYTNAEIVLLKEESYNLDRQGRIASQIKYLPTDGAFRFSVELFMRDTHPNFKLDISGKGWENLKKALVIRNRLTHPKGVADLIVSDEEVSTVLNAFGWFSFIIVTVLSSAAEAYEKEIGDLKRMLSALKTQLAGAGIDADKLLSPPPDLT